MKIKTLIVEDNPIWGSLLSNTIQKTDLFEILLVVNLTQAIEAIRNQAFDLIILDLLLPDSADEHDTIEQVTSAAPYIPIVINSTINDEKVLQKALQLGVQDFITKDQFHPDTLVHVSLLAIQRMIARISNETNKALENTLSNLKILEERLTNLELSLIEIDVGKSLHHPGSH